MAVSKRLDDLFSDRSYGSFFHLWIVREVLIDEDGRKGICLARTRVGDIESIRV